VQQVHADESTGNGERIALEEGPGQFETSHRARW
jgi:hypothetical protein